MKALPPSFGPISSVFGNDGGDKLSTGIVTSFPILRIKGKVWSITRGSDEPIILMRPGNDGPRNSLDVVILAASQHVSKVWYETGYEEGASAPPDCFSSNGIVPDPASVKKQCETCAACPQNRWGSRITPAGKKAKACGDSKRLAVAPLGDIKNESFGGPMLLRIPAASLASLGNFGDSMAARGYDYFTIGTKIAFEPTEAFPKLSFEPIRPLSDEEAQAVVELRDSEVVRTILQERPEEHVPEERPVTPAVTSKVTPLPPKPSPVTPTVAETVKHVSQHAAGVNKFTDTGAALVNPAPKPVPAGAEKAAPWEAPKEEEPTNDSFEDSLDEQIENLMSNEK